MQLRIGSYSFDANSNTIESSILPQYSEGRVRTSNIHQARVTGSLSGNGQADITAKEAALRAALARNYQDVVLLQDNGQESAVVMKNAGSLTGVLVIDGPHFRTTNGAEYSTLRTFEFTVQAEYPVTLVGPLILEFQETLTFGGGGPEYRMSRAINGPPVRQLIWPQTEFYAVQEGFAVGYSRRPDPPRAIWPGALKRSGEFSRTSPRLMGKEYRDYTITWRYEFESISPLVAEPNYWPKYLGS